MKVPPMVPPLTVTARCLRTRNECGTDTWMVGTECPCINCQRWLGRQEGRAAGFAAALAMALPKVGWRQIGMYGDHGLPLVGVRFVYEDGTDVMVGKEWFIELRAAASALSDTTGEERK